MRTFILNSLTDGIATTSHKSQVSANASAYYGRMNITLYAMHTHMNPHSLHQFLRQIAQIQAGNEIEVNTRIHVRRSGGGREEWVDIQANRVVVRNLAASSCRLPAFPFSSRHDYTWAWLMRLASKRRWQSEWMGEAVAFLWRQPRPGRSHTMPRQAEARARSRMYDFTLSISRNCGRSVCDCTLNGHFKINSNVTERNLFMRIFNHAGSPISTDCITVEKTVNHR